jgi:hypothetical protein
MLDRDKLAKILGLLGSVETGEILSAGRAADALIRNADTSWADVLNQRELLAENAKLRAMAQQLRLENNALRKKAVRRLPHRILRRRLATRHRGGESRSFRPVVVRSLVAVWVLLTPSIVAFLSLHEAGVLGEPSVRLGAVASSGQEAPEAAARSGGLPTQGERRATISGPRSTAGTLPTTSPTIARPSTESSPDQHASTAETTALVIRGDDFLSAGDVVSAREFYERAADRGDGGAALRLGATFDTGFLDRAGVRGALSDPAQASSWFRRAAELGNPAAQELMKNLEQQSVLEPGTLPH